MRIVYFTHSLASCWNHGNAHFLRGVLRELIHARACRRGLRARRQLEPREPAEGSRRRRARCLSRAPIRSFPAAATTMTSMSRPPSRQRRRGDRARMERAMARRRASAGLRRRGGRFTLLFHDTHHRAVSDPEAIRAFDLDGYDGVLAFGETLAEVYRRWGWGDRVFTWHEAADTRLFHPPADETRREGLVWIGNWGDERAQRRARELSPAARARPPACRSTSTACAIRSDALDAAAPRTAPAIAAGSRMPGRPRSSRAISRPCTCRGGSTSKRCRASRPSGSSRRWPAASRWSRRRGRIAEDLFRPGEDYLVAHRRGRDGAPPRGAARRPGASRRAHRERPRDDPGAPQLRPPRGRASGDRGAHPRRLPGGDVRMKIAFYGSSLLSSYWNGAATYYRGLLSDLARRGHDITFYEPDAFDRQKHRDIDPPDWADVRRLSGDRGSGAERDRRGGVGRRRGQGERRRRVRRRPPRRRHCRVAPGGDAHLLGCRRAGDARRAARAAPIIRCIGRCRRSTSSSPMAADRRSSPPTRASAPGAACRSTTRSIRRPISRCRRRSASPPTLPSSATACRTVRRASRHSSSTRRRGLPDRRFLIGGNGWEDKAMPPNVRHIGHVYTREHNAFNTSPLAVLNIARDSAWPTIGFSPATRVFEAAGAGACLITDAWEGIELFLEPDEEVLVARDGAGRRRAPPQPDAGAGARHRRRRRAPACWPSTPTRCAARRSTRSWPRSRPRSGRGAPHEARRPRAQPVLVLGQRPRDDLPRAAQGLCRARARHPVPRARRALVRGQPRPRRSGLLPARALSRTCGRSQATRRTSQPPTP